MLVTRYPLSTARTQTPSAITIGNFDGVHVGHSAILSDLVRYAKKHNLTPTVITFEPHPKAFLATRHAIAAPTQILPLRNKLTLLANHGIEHVVLMPFNEFLMSMSATDFVTSLLRQSLNMRHLRIGDDFRFGAQRAGDFALLQLMSTSHDFTVQAHQSVLRSHHRVSSSFIRKALHMGDVATARHLLGHKLTLSGHVIYGKQLGRTIDCPTINIKMPKHLASQGIYAVNVHLHNQTHQGVASIGTRPSVDSNGECWLEVHLLDFNQNVYGALAHVTLLHKIRDEAKFDTLDVLKKAIAQDITDARRFFASAEYMG